MVSFLKSRTGKLVLGAVALVLVAVIGLTAYHYLTPKFQTVTVELGQPVEQQMFYTGNTLARRVSLESPARIPQPEAVGQYPITFRHGRQLETVVLTVVDTVAPEATFQNITAHIDQVLDPADFVVETRDLSRVQFSFATEPVIPLDFGDATVEVKVSDSSGNFIIGTCSVRFVWLRERVNLEYGQQLQKQDVLLSADQDDSLIDQAQLDAINASGVGEYTITSTDGGQTYTCIVTVQDTTGPVLQLQDHTIYPGGKANLDSFLVSAEDISGEVTVKLVTELDRKTVGEHTVVVEATDIYGNVTRQEAKLKVIKDSAGPSFTGVEAMTVEKNSNPDFTKGVAAYDTKDGYVEFSVDTSKVKLDKSGTYYAIYTAVDSAGNKATYRRKITVLHDAADRAALVKSVADKLSSDPLRIRSYLVNNIAYQSNTWAMDDPVWHGLSKKTGNCYVQANCLKALLEAKGYQAKLIWTTCKTHYWVLVYYNGAWRHLDSTPGKRHDDILLVNDAVRYAHLQGRDWDRTKWPAAE